MNILLSLKVDDHASYSWLSADYVTSFQLRLPQPKWERLENGQKTVSTFELRTRWDAVEVDTQSLANDVVLQLPS